MIFTRTDTLFINQNIILKTVNFLVVIIIQSYQSFEITTSFETMQIPLDIG